MSFKHVTTGKTISDGVTGKAAWLRTHCGYALKVGERNQGKPCTVCQHEAKRKGP